MTPFSDTDCRTPLDSLIREALERADHASCVISAGGEIVFNNRAFRELTGFSADELAAGGYAILRQTDAPPETYRDLWRTVRDGRVWRGAISYRHKDGSPRPCSVVVTPFSTDGEAKPSHFYVTQRDISEQLVRDEERRRSREKLEQDLRLHSEELTKLYSISAALHSSFELDETLRIVLVAVTAGEGYRFNRAFLFFREHGDPGRLVGRLAMGPFDSEEAAKIWRALSEAAPHGGEPLADIVRRYSDQVEDPEGGLTQRVLAIQIPLDRDQCPLVRAVREKRSVRVEADAAREGLGCQAIATLESPAFAVVPLIYGDEAEGCILVDNAITGKPIEEEEIRILELFADHAAHAIANAIHHEQTHDLLAERNEALERLRANQERLVESEKLAALGRMAAIVVHELRTPLAVIGGYARHLLKGVEEESPLREDLSIIRDEVSRLENVVERLLFYARPKEPLLKPGRINDSLVRLLAYLGESLERHNIRVETNLDAGLEDAWFDEKQIRQVFLNLMSNAIQAMPEGGTLRVASGKRDGAVWVSVTDTGKGISPDAMSHLFEAFYTTKPKGTGLGLHVAQRIVEGHRGEIRAENQPGGGAAFVVRIPFAPGDRASDP